MSILVLNVLCGSVARAQLDPSTSLLVNRPGEEKTKANLDSGRYTVRPNSPSVPSPEVTKPPVTVEDIRKKAQEKVEQVKARQDAKVIEKAKTAVANEAAEEARAAAQAEAEASDVADSVKEIFWGGDGDVIEKYKDLLHPEDSRRNLLKLSVAPGVTYFDSSSDYWFRNYDSSGPSLSVVADIWLTPFLGFKVDYLTTLSAEMKAAPGSDESVLTDHAFTTVGFQFRKFAGLTRRSPSLTFGIGYSEYQMLVPKDEAARIRLKLSSPSLSVQARLPKDPTVARFFGIEFLPTTKIKEEKTAVSVRSGDDVKSYGLKVNFGTEYSLDRNHQIFWRASHRFDKAVYEGTANTADPITGTAPSGVDVRMGATMLEIGYSWGD